MAVYYRVVGEDVGSGIEGDDTPCIVDVILQTEDPADFSDFSEAHRVCLERLQERLDDLEEDGSAHAEKIEEWITDTESGWEDWEDYAGVKSQPDIPDPRTEHAYFTLTEVEGRRAAREFLDGGGSFGEQHDRWVEKLERYEAMAARS